MIQIFENITVLFYQIQDAALMRIRDFNKHKRHAFIRNEKHI